MIACAVLILGFIGSVGYASVALMGKKNDNYQEKVRLMQEKKAAEAAATAPVSEAVIDRSEK